MLEYAISADGFAVVRLIDEEAISGSTFSTGLLSSNATVLFSDDLTTSVSSYIPKAKGSNGFGAEFEAILGSDGSEGTLDWIQFIETNVPLGGNSSPYLDNGSAGSDNPYYPVTAQNNQALTNVNGELENGIYFYDFSSRNSSAFDTLDSISWVGDLFPTRTLANGDIEVGDGIRWGWEAKKAGVGEASGVFVDPGPSAATVSGVGTNTFTWGVPTSGNFASSLSFDGVPFDATPGEPFKIGTINYTNGTIRGGTQADFVSLDYTLEFTNVPEENINQRIQLDLLNSPNTSDPRASADSVFIEEFGVSFRVLEGASASADIVAVLNTNLEINELREAEEAGAAIFGDFEEGIVQGFNLQVVGFENAGEDSFIEIDLGLDNFLFGTDGADQLEGLNGKDTLVGGGGRDTLSGGKDDDVVEGGAGGDLLRGNAGEDRIFGGDSADQLRGQKNGDYLDGGNGNDNVKGGGGNDTLMGGLGDDFLNGGTRADSLDGGNGDDKLMGRSFSDTLIGGDGNDRLNAGGDNDRLDGGRGNDVLKGGAGADVFVFDLGFENDRLLDFEMSEDRLEITAALANGRDAGQIADLAQESSSGLELDFGDGNIILFIGLNSDVGLAGQIDIM